MRLKFPARKTTLPLTLSLRIIFLCSKAKCTDNNDGLWHHQVLDTTNLLRKSARLGLEAFDFWFSVFFHRRIRI